MDRTTIDLAVHLVVLGYDTLVETNSKRCLGRLFLARCPVKRTSKIRFLEKSLKKLES
jgi:hypothetical protein